jgi:PAS domain S-box-containing protein
MDGRRKTILIVDDVPDDIAILEAILKPDYQVKAVTSGEAALAVARGREMPDLILLDIMMPGIDGFEVCRRLKADAAGSAIPIIFLTAKIQPTDEKIGFELGAADYIRKPVDPDIVRSRVKVHLELKEQILRTSEVKYRRLFETAKDGVIIVDEESGVIVDVNPSMSTMLGLSQEAFLGKRVTDFTFFKNILERRSRLDDARRESYIRCTDKAFETFDGREIYIEYIGTRYTVNNREVLQLNIREISDLVRAERERDSLSSKLKHYLATSPTITYSMRIESGDVRMVWISENVRRILGYEHEESLERGWWFNNILAEDRGIALGIVSESSLRGSATREYRFFRKDRNIVWIRDQMRFVQADGGQSEIVGTMSDITDIKKAEAEIKQKSRALEAAANAVVITDICGVVKWANKAFFDLTGYSSDEAVGKGMGELVNSGRQDDDFYKHFWDTILAGSFWKGRLVNKKKTGETYIEEMTVTPIFSGDGRIEEFIAVKNDVTASVEAQERLEAALKEKNALLREIHHRVKNNMQVIISLLNISTTQIDDPNTRMMIDDITRRLYAMASMHEQFYAADDMSRIDFAAYICQLVEKVQAEVQNISIRLNIPSLTSGLFLNLEQAIPAGLILCELIMNSSRHAFVDRESGTIEVSVLVQSSGHLVLSVSDDGRGIPSEIDPRSAKTLGMVLVRILTEQLGGKLEFTSGKGTVARLEFDL